MDYLQYYLLRVWKEAGNNCFKPCYKWITFNTYIIEEVSGEWSRVFVLNLVINGLPSIRKLVEDLETAIGGF